LKIGAVVVFVDYLKHLIAGSPDYENTRGTVVFNYLFFSISLSVIFIVSCIVVIFVILQIVSQCLFAFLWHKNCEWN